jgi:hypothetical protein
MGRPSLQILALLERPAWVTLPADLRPPRARVPDLWSKLPAFENVRGDTRFVRYEASQDGSLPRKDATDERHPTPPRRARRLA